MALGDALEKARQASRPGSKCTMCALAASLSKDDLADLNAALADRAYAGTVIARALNAEGHESIRGYHVTRHRNNGCAGA